MRREVADFDVQDSRQAAQTLRADTQRIHFVVQLDAQLLQRTAWSARLEFCHIDRLHQRFFGEQHGFFSRTADANAQHAWRAPAGTHQRHCLQNPLDDGVGGIEHREFRLVLRASALGGYGYFDSVARYELHVDHRRRVVAGVFSTEGGIRDDRRTQRIVRVKVGAAHAFIDHLREAELGIPSNIHANLDECDDDARILADGAMT